MRNQRTVWGIWRDGLRRVFARASVVMSMLLILFINSRSACAQGRFNRNMSAPQHGTLMAAPREIQVLIEEAKSNIENRQWSEATLAIGLLLGLENEEQDDTTGVDFFLFDELDDKRTKTTVDSIYKRVFDLIESLPAEATKFIDLRYGVRASQILNKALEESDWDLLERVAGRFSFTSAGQDAGVILGEHWLRKGDARRAARLLESVFRQKSALMRLGPELGILIAASYESAGMDADAFRCIELMKNQYASVSIDWEGRKVGWDQREVRTRDIVDSLRTKATKAHERVVKQPYYFGGNSKRNADTNAGVPLPILRWHTELHESKQQKDSTEKVFREKLTEGKSTIVPSRSAINVGPWVITSTYDQRIVAIDMQTGRLGWECFYSGMPLGFSMDRFPTRDSHSLNLAAPDYLVKRVWGETAVGMPTSDGQRVFSISELPAIDIAESFAIGPNARVSKPQGVRNFNVMQCWSVPDEGKLVWEVGGQKSPAEPKLAGALFLGAPLPHNDQLFVIGELNSDLYLFSLRPETGKLLWRQPLATNLGSIATDQMRRSIGVVPAADGNVIVCPTLSGFLVGFDSVSHALLWAFPYKPKIVPGAQNQFTMFGQQEAGDFSPFLNRSADVSALIEDGVVLFAPSDGEGEFVYAISANTGEELWRSDSRKDLLRYIAGAWNGTVFVANQSSFMALDLNTGKEKWPAIELPNESQVIGRGVRKRGSYLLPTSKQEILQIDLERGVVVETVKVEKPLGNLVSIGDRLVCASPYELDCYAVREAFQSQLKEELQQSSVSKAGLIRQGELALAQSDYESALEFLEKAQKLDPKNPEVIILLNKVGLAALTSDFDKYVDRVNLSHDLAFDRERLPYLRMLVQGLQRKERYKDALVKLFELSEIRTSQRQDQVAGGELNALSLTWSVQEDRWISSQIAKCVEKLSPEDWKAIDKDVDRLLQTLSLAQSSVRRLMLDHLQSMESMESLRIESSMELIKQKDFLQAERLLQSDSFLDQADPKSFQAVRRRGLLGEIYAKTGRYELALKYLDGDVAQLAKILREVPGTRPFDSLTKFPTTARPRRQEEWPTGAVVSSTNHHVPLVIDRAAILESYATCRWKKRQGDAIQDWSVLFSQGNFLFSSRQREDEFRSFAPIGNQDKPIPTVYSVDSIVFVEMNREIIAINTLGRSNDQRGPLWREAFEQVVPEERGRGRANTIPLNSWGLPTSRSVFRVASVSRQGVVVLYEDNLICLDPLTGNRVWIVGGFKESQFATHQGALMVFNPRGRSIQKLDLRDGSILRETPLVEERNWVGTVGKYWLMESGETDTKFMLYLVDSTNGETILSRQFSQDTRLALDGETGVIALQVAGALTYWNLSDLKEYTTEVQVEGKINLVSAQRFGDTIVVLPFCPGKQLDIDVAPVTTDPAFVPVAGRIAAISAKDGSPVWKQNNLAWQFAFPLAQDRSSPVAVFVRRLTLNKIEGQTIDSMSIAAVDLRDGRVVYAKDDLPAVRDRGFSQKMVLEDNVVSVDYMGSNVTLKFLDKNTSAPQNEETKYDFGEINSQEFRRAVTERVRQKSK